MRSLGLILVMAVGATVAVYTPLKDLYPPRYQVFAFAVETVPELGEYIPTWLTAPPPIIATEILESVETRERQSKADELVESSGLDPVAEPLWTSFQSEPLRLLLDEMDFPAELTVSDGGEEMILVNRATGLDFALVLKACEAAPGKTSCRALQVAAIVFQDMDDGVVASMNRRHDGMKFAKLDGGDLQITRYVTADFGIARDNVKSNIAAFVDIIDLYAGTG